MNKPCIECPFRRESLPGWLGPWTPEMIVGHINRQPFPCHKTIKSEEQDIATDNSLQSCAGAAEFLNNQLKLSRDEKTAEHQLMFEKGGKGSHPEVFDTNEEFIQHHRSLGIVSGEMK